MNLEQNVQKSSRAMGKSKNEAQQKSIEAKESGMSVARVFSTAGIDPMSEEAGIRFEKRDASITDIGGQVIFEQKNVLIPQSWSLTASNIVVNKYFRGKLNTPERESSVADLIKRVVNTICGWAESSKYFASAADLAAFKDELTHLLITQKMAFNSPVWFNVGVEKHPQCSACFINSVEDSMDSILGLAKTEGMLFKYGSGTGTNFSSLRGKNESLKEWRPCIGPSFLYARL